MQITDFHHACSAILNSKANDYAKAYAKAGLSMFSQDECKVQALYVLSNLTHWREPNAKAIKELLKQK